MRYKICWGICQLGNLFYKISRHLSQIINWFVCHIYGWKWNNSIGEIRYQMYWQSSGKITCQQLLPCTDVLELHVLSVKQEFGGKSLVKFKSKANPEDHGSMLYHDNDKLNTTWMRRNAALDEVKLQILFSHQTDFWILSRGVSTVTS